MKISKISKEQLIKINKIMEENPDLSYEFVKSILISKQEVAAEKIEEYKFEN